VKLFFHQLRTEQLLFWRSRESAVFVFLFPLLLFALLTAVIALWAAGQTINGGLQALIVSRFQAVIVSRIRPSCRQHDREMVAHKQRKSNGHRHCERRLHANH